MNRAKGSGDHYHYTACGLKNVWLMNGVAFRDTPHGRAVSIRDQKGLHLAIGSHLAHNKPGLLSSTEIRFLRKELDLSQATLARLMRVTESTYRNWENNRTKISGPADALLRRLFIEHGEGDGTVRELIQQLAELDRRPQARIEFSIDRSGWHRAA